MAMVVDAVGNLVAVHIEQGGGLAEVRVEGPLALAPDGTPSIGGVRLDLSGFPALRPRNGVRLEVVGSFASGTLRASAIELARH